MQLQVLSVIAVAIRMERKPFNEEHLQWEKIHINKFEENNNGAAKANNSKDTYLATAVTFMVIGALFLIDKLIHFSSIGLPW